MSITAIIQDVLRNITDTLATKVLVPTAIGSILQVAMATAELLLILVRLGGVNVVQGIDALLFLDRDEGALAAKAFIRSWFSLELYRVVITYLLSYAEATAPRLMLAIRQDRTCMLIIYPTILVD